MPVLATTKQSRAEMGPSVGDERREEYRQVRRTDDIGY